MHIVAGDIGGTHARFAVAEIAAGERPRLGPMRKYRTREHPSLASAWAQFRSEHGGALPDAAAFGVATPMDGELLRFTNSDWVIDRRTVQAELGLTNLLLLNDFGAVAYAVSALPPEALRQLAGPAGGALAEVTTVLGLGTGLGVAILLRRGGSVEVIETEAAHIAFAPDDEREAALARAIRQRHGRCSVERIVSGPGLVEIYGQLNGGASAAHDPGALWSAALAGADPGASDALDLLVGCLGAVAGDLALAHGSMSVVITGGLANRMPDRLASPVFHERFLTKGRYRPRMERIPIFLATEPEPGLLGAAIAYQRAFTDSTG
jgi:glucokinase